MTRICCLFGLIVLNYATLVQISWAQVKPTTRNAAETRSQHLNRYTDAEFASITRALGVTGTYPPNRAGYAIGSVRPGTAAKTAGLKAGDVILEVDGVPVGRYGARKYYVWKRYAFAPTNTVEFTIAIPDGPDHFRYYYPKIPLDQVDPNVQAPLAEPESDG